MAADACKKGKVLMGGTNMKASREVKVGDVVQIKRPPVVFSFKVLALSENRMGAKLVFDFMENVTPADQYEILELAMVQHHWITRPWNGSSYQARPSPADGPTSRLRMPMMVLNLMRTAEIQRIEL